MFLKNLKISNQLILGFIAMFSFVVIIGFVSYHQNNAIHEQTKIMYEHPLKVRRAISEVKINMLELLQSTTELSINHDDIELQEQINSMKVVSLQMKEQFNLLDKLYLGDKRDVKALYEAFTVWDDIRKINVEFIVAGKYELAQGNLKDGILTGKYYAQIINRINILDTFEIQKSEKLFVTSNQINNDLAINLYLLGAFITLLIVLISWYIIKNIQHPIAHLTNVAQQFQAGNYLIRSNLSYKNEFGILSNSFNSMIDSITTNMSLNEKSNHLVDAMMSTENAHAFFRDTLAKISELTNSQMAAVYLLSDDKNYFEHYESIGSNIDTLVQRFEKSRLEGEFGAVLTTRKIAHIRNIPVDTSFVLKFVAGHIIPREMITIPIIASNEVVAIISLASIRKYSDEANLIIENNFTILTSRVEGILNYRKIRKFLRKLEIQNVELETQKSALDAQSVELMEQNIELETQKNFLNEASKLKTNFLSNMSHELRTPLNSVIALSGVLGRKLKSIIPADEYSYLEVIERNGKNLLLLINDILDISRIEAGREEIDITNFTAQSLVEDLISLIKPQADLKNIELNFVNHSEAILLSSDVNKCRHILQNLLANAIKFTEKGKVDVVLIKQNDTIEFSITDTGIGISKDNQLRIFDEFRQADNSTSRRYGGTGLGLSIAKKYAHLLGGSITVDSIPEVGSTFTLILPLKYDEANKVLEKIPFYTEPRYPKKEEKLVQMNIAKKGHKTILIVDDSEPAVIQMKDFLISSGFKVLTAQNGKEALEVISQIIPDAMILDLMMPVIDGFQVLKTIREAEPTAHIPVLVLTAKHISKNELQDLTKNNVHQLIQKGDVNKDELIKSIKELTTTKKTEVHEKKPRPLIEGKPRVLIVEDNEDNMTTVKAILNDLYDIIEAKDGEQGVIMAEEHMPDFILMDIALPVMDGIQAFHKIRMNGKLEHIPIIALTASAMTSDRETILAYGFDSYIVKPIDEREFFSTINQVLYGK